MCPLRPHRYIQNESLSYLILPALETYGAVAHAESALTDVKRFQSHGFAEMPDALFLSFQHANYPQALEFVSLRRSLEHSWWCAHRAMLVAARAHT